MNLHPIQMEAAQQYPWSFFVLSSPEKGVGGLLEGGGLFEKGGLIEDLRYM